MKVFLNSLFWAIFGIVLDRCFDIFIAPAIRHLRRKYDVWFANRLYYSDRTAKFMKTYYGSNLYDCFIGGTSKQISFLSHPDWLNLNVDILENSDIVKMVMTDKCDYPIHIRRLESRKKRGYRLDDNPSLFLHRVISNNGSIQFEVGEYRYFQRISFTTDFEKETYRCIFFNNKHDVLRKRFMPKAFSGSLTSENTVPFGCDTVIATRDESGYSICIHTRSNTTVNYPGGTMVVPSFGFGSIKSVKNPLLFSILREYCEELFDYQEMETVDKHVNPYWFYEHYPEVRLLKELQSCGKLKLILTGCGFDAIGGFFNLETLLIIDDESASHEIFKKCKGNWETKDNLIQFVSIDSPVFENLLNNNHLTPTSAVAIQRAITILSKLNNS